MDWFKLYCFRTFDEYEQILILSGGNSFPLAAARLYRVATIITTRCNRTVAGGNF